MEETSKSGDPAAEEKPEAVLSLPFSTFGWKTDFQKHSIDFKEILSGGPGKDGIPAIDAPQFDTVDDATGWLEAQEPVQVLELNGEVRAYPLQILIWHEIVNDTVGGVPVTVTYCPLCNTAIVFDRRLGERVLDFGVSGFLRFSDLIMYDRQTESWWQQISGEAIVGELLGQRLEFIPSPIVSFDEFRQAHPDGQVLNRDTGNPRPYGENPYVFYDSSDPFLFRGPRDGRLRPTERVVAISQDSEAVAFPFSVLEKEPVVHYTLAGQDLVVFFKMGTASALDDRVIAEGIDVGASNVFRPMVDGQTLTFQAQGDAFVDQETGSTWNLLGQAVDGPLAGKSLEPVVHANHFWFAWVVFQPDTVLYQGAG